MLKEVNVKVKVKVRFRVVGDIYILDKNTASCVQKGSLYLIYCNKACQDDGLTLAVVVIVPHCQSQPDVRRTGGNASFEDSQSTRLA